MYIIFVGWNT